MLYRTADLVLDSNVPLPELVKADGQTASACFRLLEAQAPAAPLEPWFHQWDLPDGKPWLFVARLESGYLLRFQDLADFEVYAGGDVTCCPQPGTPIVTIRHLYLDQVLPLVMAQMGRPVLHASAVRVPGGVIAFLGPAGRGKSTLAGSFALAGCPLVTDDCLVLRQDGGRFNVIPSYPGLRLWPDVASILCGDETALGPVAHYTSKSRLDFAAGRFPYSEEPGPLARFYVLAPAEENGQGTPLRIERLARTQAFMQLLEYQFLLDVADQGWLAEQFETLSQVVSAVPVCRLSFPRGVALLLQVREAILADVSYDM